MKSDFIDKIIKIRVFEEYVLKLFGEGKVSGTTHTYIGQEATAVAIMSRIRDDDFVFSNHRCHGHYLAYGGPQERLLAEIMSKESGLCNGRGGSQHIHYNHFFTNGIQGGIVPNAVGVALTQKGKNGCTIVFLGDGTLGQGVVYESLNIAAVYDAQVLFVVEDNQYAMSTRREDVISGDIAGRISGFGIEVREIESTDVDELAVFFEGVFSYLRKEKKPICAIVHNYRLVAHSKGDDTRPKDEIQKHREKDPINYIKNAIGEDEYNKRYLEMRHALDGIVADLESENDGSFELCSLNKLGGSENMINHIEARCVERIRSALEFELNNHEEIVIMGEDIRDPYGGAFKVTKGLSEQFGDRVMNMPISEAAMTGIAVGMAIAGAHPVVEMMFGDFVSLAFDQLINHAAKYRWVYGEDVKVPMVVRCPMGAKRGYGPTHSQSLEKFLLGIPLIRVIALSNYHDPYLIYKKLFENITDPTVVIENKKMYAEVLDIAKDGYIGFFAVEEVNNYGFSSLHMSLDNDNEPDAYIITYGGMAKEAALAAEELMMQDEIQADIIVLSQILPVPIDDLLFFIKRRSIPVYTVEEGTKIGGVGAEIIAECIENGINCKYHRIASPDCPVPNGIKLEKGVIPDKDIIKETLRRDNGIPV